MRLIDLLNLVTRFALAGRLVQIELAGFLAALKVQILNLNLIGIYYSLLICSIHSRLL